MRYCAWLHDEEVNRYLVVRHAPPKSEDLLGYVEKINSSEDTLLLGMFSMGVHIGNIKLGPIQFSERKASLGLIIGEKKYWGRGYATEAIRLVCEYGFSTYGLTTITAGYEKGNHGSRGAFMKAGFKMLCEESIQLIEGADPENVVKMSVSVFGN